MNCPICKTGSLEAFAHDIRNIPSGIMEGIRIYTTLECDNSECGAEFSDSGTFETINNWHSDNWPMQEYKE